jgi:hypothetical protein
MNQRRVEKQREPVGNLLRDGLKILFFAQIFIFAWFTGAFVRNERSPYLWIEYSRSVDKFGNADALFGAFLYLLYYCFLIEASGLVLWSFLIREKPMEKGSGYDLLVCSSWVLFSFLTLGDSVFRFLRSLPTDVANGWLLIGWIASTVIAGRSLWRLLDVRLKEYRYSSLAFRYEQFLIRHELLGQFFEEEKRLE